MKFHDKRMIPEKVKGTPQHQKATKGKQYVGNHGHYELLLSRAIARTITERSPSIRMERATTTTCRLSVIFPQRRIKSAPLIDIEQNVITFIQVPSE
jgi:hypothetical protein